MLDIVVGLGANLGAPRTAFADAREALRQRAGRVVSSALYRSRAVGPAQPDYLNAALRVTWREHLGRLLDLCHELEAAAGRDRTTEVRWGPRELDLDLLIADGLVCRGPDLELPHPRLAERAFAVLPAADVAGCWVHPVRGRTLRELADAARTDVPHAVDLVDTSW
jgi:2-amino-4-hydroxy-6-hydroxymethyldihydropteridine diphosphokinase